ncbi:uncharacterized protein BO97DRAFT_464386 [Aspergillus homomorphus CBS 101889]|uniref:Alpha-1,3-mannosyltransferase n=1 Tax=Aspergillus homomorphus (strain CBS 101889) TaxID=1450537 RepID=A0A395HHF1_ASPHC|nr:hypothetical protein BO97DRAFT_464386 [Aspergillus homomorphus CBS 101889]RAL07247.1 hypothetical protein BO97DRAFT_464386 [Aspergillus homomorphus CBS 101889]
MFTLSHFPNQSRRGAIISRTLIIVLLVGYCFKATLLALSYHHSEQCTQQLSPLQKLRDPSPAQPQWPHAFHPQHRNAHPPSNTARENFTRDFEHLLRLIPDDSHARDLTSAITSTGEEKLRELGFRTRGFKALFKAWSTLHLVGAGDQMLVRDDILQLLRDYPELSRDLHLDPTTATHAYEAARTFLTQVSTRLFPWLTPSTNPTSLYAHLHPPSRGLVFTAGDDQALYLETSIRSLRNEGCTLPIEVMYLGDEDLSVDAREALESLPGVITRDLRALVNDEGWTLRGWAAKPFAILHSSFREAVFVDADSLFIRDPAALFDDPGYRATGALFFKDRLLMPGSKRAWLRRVLPAPVSKQARRSRLWTGQSIHMQESGVVVVDKWRHFVALLLVARLNGPDRDGNEAEGRVGVYDMVYGDKETFWLGWELVGDTEYAFHEGAAAVMGAPQVNPQAERNGTAGPRFNICAPQLLHLGADGRPLWFNGWLLPNKFSENQRQQPTAFEAFIPEPSDAEAVGAWELKQSNVCCLSADADRVISLNAAEKRVLGGIVKIAREVGAISDDP